VASSFIRGALFRCFFEQTRVFAAGGVFDCRGIYHPLLASACFLGRDPKRRDEVIWVGGWIGVLDENSVLGIRRNAICELSILTILALLLLLLLWHSGDLQVAA
jgi:hypothetical protein